MSSNWREAESLVKLREQLNEMYPTRNKSEDGTIGDVRHQQEHSDHNPNSHDVVCALDVTHDPASGCDSYKLAEQLRTNPDARLQYIISNRKIANADPVGGAARWEWRPYNGSNPHDLHVHFSARQEPSVYDNAAPWTLQRIDPAGEPRAVTHPKLRRGSKGEEVSRVQYLVGAPNDGKFGAKTEAAVKAFQDGHGLVADGIVGGYTWRELDKLSEPWRASPPQAGATPAAGPENAPATAPAAERKVLFEARGKMSTFGGQTDSGMKTVEGLALYNSVADFVRHGIADYIGPPTPYSGLGRRLNTSKFYIACRWDPTTYPRLRDSVAHVTNVRNGKTALLRPVDYGPNEKTGRVADLSPGAAAYLGLETNDVCEVVVYEDGK